jgi:hypothetical protein
VVGSTFHFAYAEREGFEPSTRRRVPECKSGALDRSAISPTDEGALTPRGLSARAGPFLIPGLSSFMTHYRGKRMLAQS